MTTLAISHNLFLTRDERYRIYGGEAVQTVGVSLPIWWKGVVTSEPGVEVFCLYTLRRVGDILSIKSTSDGYIIHLPPGEKYEPLSNDMWNSLTKDQQELWYRNHEPSPSVDDLKDLKDGGREWLAFRQLQNITKNKKILDVVHFVEIKPMEILLESLT
jgi:hypothetical protein